MSEKNQYAETLNLPRTDFPMRGNLPQWEPVQLAAWQDLDLYSRLLSKYQSRPRFIFHDGPPYANGDIHIGHALNKTLKDIVCRFATMRGYNSPFVPGWDTHGMPIEHAAIKQLGLNIHEIEPLELRHRCETWAREWIDKQRTSFKRLGIIANWEHPYVTLEKEYEGVQMGIFAEFVRRGAIYKGLRPVQWCPVCETALADAEVEYENKSSFSIHVAFDVVGDPRGILPPSDLPYSFVIWTTTPWTLPANMGICLGKDFRYIALQTARRVFIVAKELQTEFLSACNLQVEAELSEFSGKELEGILCQHPFIDRTSLVILGDHVTLDTGTGCVHTSPGHGYEDFLVGKAYGLEILNPTDGSGHFTDDAGKYKGLFIEEANPIIVADLLASGHLLAQSKLEHQYPHCWRCHQPLMFRATEQWFATVSSFTDEALAEIDRVQWFPSSGKVRLSNMIRERGDWCISRQRSWGVPLPIFYCRSCGRELLTYESVMVVQELFAQKGSNSWFEMEAEEILPPGQFSCSCGSTEFVKEKDIMDVWFDAGSSHAAVLDHWPELKWPATVYLEGSDQYRGWFQSSLWTGIVARGRAPFDQIVACGFVVDGEGRKMSKSLGNGIEPDEVIKEYGADILRLWAFASDFKSADVRISKPMLKQISDAYRKLRNTVRFLLSNLYDYDPDQPSPSYDDLDLLDRMMLNRLYQVHAKITECYETYEYHQIYHALYHFCTVDLSAFYLDVLKDRLYASHPDAPERKKSQYVLYTLADCLIRFLVPVLNFTTEAMYAHLPRKSEDAEVAAIFLDWPELPDQWHDDALTDLYARVMSVRDEVNKVVEQARSSRVIGSTLDAHIELWADKGLYDFLTNHSKELPAWFIASRVSLYSLESELPEGVVCGDIAGLGVRVSPAAGLKCDRCWTFYEDESGSGLCPRCAEVMEILKG